MPRRKTILVTGEFYHVYNRSNAGIPLFKGPRECNLFIEAVRFYLQAKPPTKFSVYRRSRNSFTLNLDKKLVSIINYCLMPNHFHFTLRQEIEGGIKQFIHRISNSFAHYFSTKYKTKGHIFEDKFKAVHVETEEQLIHLSRYIHLNPVTSYLVEKPEDYLQSSYKIYLGEIQSDIIDTSPIISTFKSRQNYRDFVFLQKDYQRSLEKIKHLTFE